VLLCFPSVISAQQPDPRDVETDQPEKTTLPSGVNRIAGLEANSKIHYVCLIPFESLDTPSLGDSPSLIAQCTLKPSGKSSFELLTNFGGATTLPSTPVDANLNAQPLSSRTEKVTLTMAFLATPK
jgi:hypothetical protein